MLFQEVTTACTVNHTKQMQISKLLNAELDGTRSYHWAFNG